MKTLATNDSLIYELLNDSNYRISPTGAIRTKITVTGKLSVTNTWRTCNQYRKGYSAIKYKRHQLSVARIVYAKYLAGTEGFPLLTPELKIFFKDGDHMNTWLRNLKAGTQADLNLHRFRALGKGAVIGNRVLNWGLVGFIRDAKFIKKWSHNKIARTYNISKGHVSQIINNKIWIEGKNYAELSSKTISG